MFVRSAATSKNAADLNSLRETAKAMVAAISELLKVVKLVGDEATRGLRAIDSAIEAISASVVQMESTEPPQGAWCQNGWDDGREGRTA